MTPAAATLLIANARLWTDGARGGGEEAVAIAGERILACGPSAEIEPLAGRDATRLDARGATVTPGLWDAHLHLMPWARARAEVDLSGAASAADACRRVSQYLAAHPGAAPVVGRGWDANDWPEPPHRAALDALSPGRPLLLHSHDFHAMWVNGAALRAAGITRETRDPAGGVIERDANGEPRGIVRENAVRPLRALEEQAAAAAGDPLALLADAAHALHAQGITAVHDFERGAAAFERMERFARAPGPRAARVRVVQCVDPDDLPRVATLGLRSGDGDDAFRVGAVKLFADGTLGSRTAAMLEPYEGSGERGLEVLAPRDLDQRLAAARAANFAVAVHAVGDRACRNALDAFERLRGNGRFARPALADRLEHIQLLSPADLPRFAALDVAASMQPLHCTADAPLARRHWGTRCRNSYPWRALLDAGAALAFGSDAPVEPPAAGATLAAACTRVTATGEPFEGAQCVTLDEALLAYTAGAARLAGAWPRLGSLRAGSLADLVIWDRDLHAVPPARLHEARPSCTLADGVVVHSRDAAARPAAHQS
jgi:predicted amidohydrolase YtcJ